MNNSIAVLASVVILSVITNCYSWDKNHALENFINHNDRIYKHEFISSEQSKRNSDITIKTYKLYSQIWPLSKNTGFNETIWEHKLVFYIPKNIVKHQTALLFVFGGMLRDKNNKELPLSNKNDKIDFEYIADKNKAVVIKLLNVPNQYLFFNGKPVKEDSFIAATYKKFLEDPEKNVYLLGLLPMTKTILKSMDAIQTIDPKIKNFVLAGASKRARAIWLATLADYAKTPRVKAIINISMDAFNIRKIFEHAFNTIYKNKTPLALRDYEHYGITKDTITNSAFTDLLQIEDPFNYLGQKKYRQILSSLSIFIVNATGDNLFPPESSRFYFSILPCSKKYIRYLPNAEHNFNGNNFSDSTSSLSSINNSINSYFYFILNNTQLPNIKWTLNKNNIKINTSLAPTEIKLWTAENNKRDFRLISCNNLPMYLIREITFKPWHYTMNRFHVCPYDTCYKKQDIVDIKTKNSEINIPLPPTQSKYQATFVELHYDISGTEFVTTTEVDFLCSAGIKETL